MQTTMLGIAESLQCRTVSRSVSLQGLGRDRERRGELYMLKRLSCQVVEVGPR